MAIIINTRYSALVGDINIIRLPWLPLIIQNPSCQAIIITIIMHHTLLLLFILYHNQNLSGCIFVRLEFVRPKFVRLTICQAAYLILSGGSLSGKCLNDYLKKFILSYKVLIVSFKIHGLYLISYELSDVTTTSVRSRMANSDCFLPYIDYSSQSESALGLTLSKSILTEILII